MNFTLGLGILAVGVASMGWGQTGNSSGQSTPPSPVSIRLEEAIHRARANDPSYATASADYGLAALDRSLALAGLLPNVVYHNGFLYTQPNGLLNQAGQGAAAQPARPFAWLSKPVSPQKLLATVQSALKELESDVDAGRKN